jgi:shikimate kinase
MGGNGRQARARVVGNVFLVGMMGAGKTAVGKLLARRLGKAFHDCDQEIERATGVRIPVIFDIEGEAGFRAREARMLAELTQRTGIVLATGGGAVLSAENRRRLAENGIVVYLRADTRELARRTRHDRNRPLLAGGDPLATLERLSRERDPLYREIADIVVDTGAQSAAALAHEIERRLVRFEAAAGKPAPRAEPA